MNFYIGVDESGKGDFFGPLVIAGIISSDEINQKLITLGVRDSKKLSDKKIVELAEEIKRFVFTRSL
jgi:ribonuclease HIII